MLQIRHGLWPSTIEFEIIGMTLQIMYSTDLREIEFTCEFTNTLRLFTRLLFRNGVRVEHSQFKLFNESTECVIIKSYLS